MTIKAKFAAAFFSVAMLLAATAHAINWAPVASGKPTVHCKVVYVSTASTTNPWANGAATSPTYAHHPAAMVLDNGGTNRVYCSWSTHPLAEDARGQWVAYAYSDDIGVTWSTSAALFNCQDAYNYESYEAPGYRLQNIGWVVYDGHTYALCQCNLHPRLQPRTVCYFIREVSIGSLGTLYRLGSWGEFEFPSVSVHADSAAILAQIRQPDQRPYMLQGPAAYLPDSPDLGGASVIRLVEPASILKANGDTLRLWRANSGSGLTTTVFHASTISGGAETFNGPTPIPNDPSASAFLQLSNGKLALAGNFIASNQRRVIQLATSTNDGNDWQKLYEVWTQGNVSAAWIDTSRGSQYKGGGQAYPCMIEVDGYLLLFASLWKEYILCNRIPMSSL